MRQPGVKLFALTTSAALIGIPVAASAVILIVVVSLLTLFAIVGVVFTTAAGDPVRLVTLHVVPVPDDAAECDLQLQILDELGQVLESRDARGRAGEAVSHEYRGQGARGQTERIRIAVSPRPSRDGCPTRVRVPSWRASRSPTSSPARSRRSCCPASSVSCAR